MKKLIVLLFLALGIAGYSQPVSQMQVYTGKLDSFYVPAVFKVGPTWFNRRIPAGQFATPNNSYTETFAGTSTNQFTLSKTPVASTIVVYVNGVRLIKDYFTVSVNTVLIGAANTGYSTDTFDKIEITYQSIF